MLNAIFKYEINIRENIIYKKIKEGYI